MCRHFRVPRRPRRPRIASSRAGGGTRDHALTKQAQAPAHVAQPRHAHGRTHHPLGMTQRVPRRARVASAMSAAPPTEHHRLGSRARRLRSSHSYGYVLGLIIASFVFAMTASDDEWAASVLLLLYCATLVTALWTSGRTRLNSRTTVALTWLAAVAAAAQLVFGGDAARSTRGAVHRRADRRDDRRHRARGHRPGHRQRPVGPGRALHLRAARADVRVPLRHGRGARRRRLLRPGDRRRPGGARVLQLRDPGHGRLRRLHRGPRRRADAGDHRRAVGAALSGHRDRAARVADRLSPSDRAARGYSASPQVDDAAAGDRG